jgi:UDPglucose 6-dehydrogenase
MPVQGVDVLAVLTEWDEVRAADLARNNITLAKPFVVDLRNIYPTGTREPGFRCLGVSRGVTEKVVDLPRICGERFKVYAACLSN